MQLRALAHRWCGSSTGSRGGFAPGLYQVYTRFTPAHARWQVVRLFDRLKALRKIIAALLASLLPVANAFVLVFIIMCICEMSRPGVNPV